MRSIASVTFQAFTMLLALGLNGALAAETGKSLSEQRNGIFQGTSRGILLFGGDTAKPAVPASGAKASVTSSSSPGPASTASVDATAQDRSPVFGTPSLNKLAPPSGIPLNAVRHQVGPDRGVALPVAKTASDAKP